MTKPHTTRVAAAPLSWHYDTVEYRLGPTQPKATWTSVTGSAAGAACDECARLQHETRGAFGPRMRPRHQRTVLGGGPTLALCGTHATAWRDRDADDTLPTYTRKTHR